MSEVRWYADLARWQATREATELGIPAEMMNAQEHETRDTPPRAFDSSAVGERRSARLTRIEAGRDWSAKLHEVWEFRGTLYFIVRRDLTVRYRQTVFGAMWALAQPLLLMLVFTLFAGKLLNAPSDGLPYPVFAYAALVPWTLFSQTLTGAAESLVRDANLVSKIFFPRLILPLAATISYLVDFLISFALLVIIVFAYGLHPSVTAVVTIPLLALLTFALGVGVAAWLSALNVMYRDIRQAVPLLSQLWLFATPIAYPASVVPEQWQIFFALNPMAGVVEGFRSAFLGTPLPSVGFMAVSIGVTLALLVTGIAYFRRVDRLFADVI